MNSLQQNSKNFFSEVWQGIKLLKTTNLSSIRKVFSLMGKKEKIAVFVLSSMALANFFWSGKNLYHNFTIPAPTFGGKIIEGFKGQPVYINPILAYQEPDLSLTKLVFSGLYKYDSTGKLQPDLAESMPQISEDQKSYTIKIKQGVKWHNGRDLNSDDVIFTIQTLKDPAFKSPLRNQWLSTSIQKIDEYTVLFTTQDISAPFLNNLTLGILPEINWMQIEPQNFHLSELNLKPIGTGPYAVKTINKLQSGQIQSYTLESFSNYHFGKPKIDSLEIKFYENEEELIQALQSREIKNFGYSSLSFIYSQNISRTDLQNFNLPIPQYQVIFFNQQKPILAEKSVRQSLALGLDKQKIIEKVFEGSVALPTLPLLSHFGDTSIFSQSEFNPEKAKTVLENSGWKITDNNPIRSKQKQNLSLTFVANDMPQNKKVAEIIAQNWRDLGIEVNLKILSSKKLTEDYIKPRNFDVLLFPQRFSPDPDPFAFWHSSQIKDPGLNLSSYQNNQVDKLINEARSSLNTETRKQKYQQIENLLIQDLPVLFINQAKFIYYIDKKIKNFNIQSLYYTQSRFYDITNWYIEEQRVLK